MSRYVGGPRLETSSTSERADAIKLRLEQLKAERQQGVEDLMWDRVDD